MLKYCIKFLEVYYNNHIISNYSYPRIINETEVSQETQEMINWNNIKIFYETNSFRLDFWIKETKKGLKIGDNHYSWNIKQWKEPNLNMYAKTYYKEVKVSINEILRYNDNEKAIQYLIERGMNFIK